MASAHSSSETKVSSSPWRGFAQGTWQSRVNVREFIQRNYTPYEGDGKFLQGATERTQGLWQKLLPLPALLFGGNRGRRNGLCLADSPWRIHDNVGYTTALVGRLIPG